MKDFSVLWAGDYVSVVSPNDAPYEALFEKDTVHVIAIDVATSEVFIRREVCPPYSMRDERNYPQFQTVVSGAVEENESLQDAVIREVREELGIDLSTAEYELIPLTPENIPYNKSTVSRITLYALMLFRFDQEIPEGDGTPYEELSTFERVPLQQVDHILQSPQCDFLLHAALSKLKCFILLDQ